MALYWKGIKGKVLNNDHTHLRDSDLTEKALWYYHNTDPIDIIEFYDDEADEYIYTLNDCGNIFNGIDVCELNSILEELASEEDEEDPED